MSLGAKGRIGGGRGTAVYTGLVAVGDLDEQIGVARVTRRLREINAPDEATEGGGAGIGDEGWVSAGDKRLG